jgi:autophagy-related protein 2
LAFHHFPFDSAQNVGSVDETEATHTPAIDLHARFTWTSAEEGLISGKGLDDHVELDVVPLHVFGDLGLVLGDNALVFVNEAASRYIISGEGNSVDNEDGERDSDMANAATLRTETDIEKEGLACLASETQRLDLDDKRIRKVGLEGSTPASRGQQADKVSSRPLITLHYFILPFLPQSLRTSFWQRLEIVVNLSMIRFQCRCPPPPLQTPRSGAVILDLHDVNVSIKATSDKTPAVDVRSPTPSLASHAHNLSPQDAPFIAECRRLVIATSLPGQEIANIVLSLGSLCSEDFTPCDTTTSSSTSARLLPLRVTINRSASPTRSPSSTPLVGVISVTIDSPSAHVDLPKTLLEGLQLWAADVSQLAEQTFGTIVWDTDTRGESRFTSLMRSIFFAKSRRYGRSNDQGGVSGAYPKARMETVISSALSEGMRTDRRGTGYAKLRMLQSLLGSNVLATTKCLHQYAASTLSPQTWTF